MKGAVVLNRSCGCVEWLAVTAVRAVWFFRALALPAPRPVSPELNPDLRVQFLTVIVSLDIYLDGSRIRGWRPESRASAASGGPAIPQKLI